MEFETGSLSKEVWCRIESRLCKEQKQNFRLAVKSMKMSLINQGVEKEDFQIYLVDQIKKEITDDQS